MLILGIESSCDETAAAVVKDGVEILSNVVVSQIDIFKEYGGVIPEVAARSHLEAILPVVKKALEDAGVKKEEIDAIAVTYAPGLLGSLLIGTLTARMLAILWGKPLYAVHHLKSHIYANWLRQEDNLSALPQSEVSLSKSNPLLEGRDFDPAQPHAQSATISEEQINYSSAPANSCVSDPSGGVPQFPLVALVVSGGHTQIIYMPAHNKFEIIGTTRDDAVGECFDKVAKILGLPYPGGPSIAKCAAGLPCSSPSDSVTLPSSKDSDPRQPGYNPQEKSTVTQLYVGDPHKYKLPHPNVEGLDFSFSGLKTAVLRAVQAELGLPISTPSYELAGKLSEQQRADFAASFQKTAVDILLDKLEMALRAHSEVKTVVLAGGVSANKVLREEAIRRFRMRQGAMDCSQGWRSLNAPLAGWHSDPRQPQTLLATHSSSPQSQLIELISQQPQALPDISRSSAKIKTPKSIASTQSKPLKSNFSQNPVWVFFPEVRLAGDNAAMVGAAAYFEITSGVKPTDPYSLDIMPRVEIR